jgi:hypothetical protein
MVKIKLTLYFGAKQQGAFGDFADTVKCEIPTDKVDDITKALTTQQWVSIALPNGKRMVNTSNLRWFDIEAVNDEEKDDSKTDNFGEILSALFGKRDKNA